MKSDKAEITFVYAYYENGGMFRLQQAIWNSYPKSIRDRVEFIVTDDCSSKDLARKNILPDNDINLTLYEITVKKPWNWLAARNIGAKHARGNWLLLTDMDHVVMPGEAGKIMGKLPHLDSRIVYQFGRVKAPDMTEYKFHNDSFFLSSKLFWLNGGYDEDFSGLYGTSGRFRDRLFKVARSHEKWEDIVLVLYSREVIPDASTTEFTRKEGRDPEAISRVERWKRKEKREIQLFLQPYRRVKPRWEKKNGNRPEII